MNAVRWIVAVVLGLVLVVLLMDTATLLGSHPGHTGPADFVVRGLVLLGGIALVGALVGPRRRPSRPAPDDREQPR